MTGTRQLLSPSSPSPSGEAGGLVPAAGLTPGSAPTRQAMGDAANRGRLDPEGVAVEQAEKAREALRFFFSTDGEVFRSFLLEEVCGLEGHGGARRGERGAAGCFLCFSPETLRCTLCGLRSVCRPHIHSSTSAQAC